MYKIYLGLVLSLISLTALATVPGNVELGECPASLPEVDPEQCNVPGYFEQYRTESDTVINQMHDEKANEIHQDNQAHANTVVESGGDNLRNFAQCQANTCEAYRDTCSGPDISDVSRRMIVENYDRCLEQSSERLNTSMNFNRAVVHMNATRKRDTTIEEVARDYEELARTVLMPILEDIVRLTRQLADSVAVLTTQVRETDAGLQSGPR